MQDDRKGWIVGGIQLVFVIAVIGVALFLTNALKAKNGAPPPGQIQAASERSTDVSAVIPTRETYAATVQLNGVIQSQTQTRITPQVGGRVVYVSPNFKPGATVAQGEVLFRIDPSDYELAVEQAEANIASAVSDLALLEAEAQLAIEEWQELFPGRPITDLAARKPQIAAARSRLASAQAAQKTSQLALTRTRITASADARVLSTTLNEGQVVAPNVSVGDLYALNSVEVRAPLSTEQIATLTPVIGRTATLTPRGNGVGAINGTVTRLDATLDARTRLATAFISLDTLAGVTVGDFIDVTMQADPVADAMVIPASSFFGRNEVWVIVNGALERRSLIRLGERGSNAVVQGFDYGEGVITLPPVEGYEGMKVSLRTADEDRKVAGGQNAG
jgi:RND family efflux transporter MFP subunit